MPHPTAVECSVGSVYRQMWTPEYLPEGCPPSSYVALNFDGTKKNPYPIKMIWSDGGIRPERPELIPADEDMGHAGGVHGVLMIGEKGIITCGDAPNYYNILEFITIATTGNASDFGDTDPSGSGKGQGDFPSCISDSHGGL